MNTMIASAGKVPKKPVDLVAFYATTVAVIGFGIAIVAAGQLPDDRFGLLLFAVLAAISELGSVELFPSSRSSRVSVSGIVAISSLLLFGPWAGALVHMCSGLVTVIPNTLLTRLPEEGRASWFRRASFNTGMYIIAATLAGWTFLLLGGTPGQIISPRNVIPTVAAATVDTLANIAILIGVLSIQTGRSVQSIWKKDFRWSAPISIVGGIIGGGVLAMAYEGYGVLGLAIFFVPVLSIGYSFRLYVNNSKSYVTRLQVLNQDLERTNLQLFKTLAAVIDAYDMYTYGHSTQVAVYCSAIAEKMNLSPEDRDTLLKAALVHDIGKVGISDTIIRKPGPLTDEEYNIVKRHPDIGAKIVGQMSGLHAVVPLVRHHHERWDGKGYPDGLQGEEIPLGARILSLADTVDTLCSDRPYRATRSFKAVLEEIKRCSGTQFDPQVVEAFLKVAEEKGRDFFKNSAALVDLSLSSHSEALGDDWGYTASRGTPLQ